MFKGEETATFFPTRKKLLYFLIQPLFTIVLWVLRRGDWCLMAVFDVLVTLLGDLHAILSGLAQDCGRWLFLSPFYKGKNHVIHVRSHNYEMSNLGHKQAEL